MLIGRRLGAAPSLGTIGTLASFSLEKNRHAQTLRNLSPSGGGREQKVVKQQGGPRSQGK